MSRVTPQGLAAPQKRGAVKRRAVLDAARRVFVEHGFRGASMELIAAAAAVSKPTVYHHFGSKERLFAAILEEAVEQILLPLHANSDEDTDPRQTLLEIARGYARVLLSPDMIEFHRLALSEASRFPELGRQYYRSGPKVAVAGIADYIRQLTERGVLTAADPVLAAHHFWALVFSAPRLVLLFDPSELADTDIDRFVRSGVEVFLARYWT
jgi:TetR/AcrR family transcriptional regulator, mexJK operon transcriptional repressor